MLRPTEPEPEPGYHPEDFDYDLRLTCYTCGVQEMEGWEAGGPDNDALFFCQARCLISCPGLFDDEIKWARRTEEDFDDESS